MHRNALVAFTLALSAACSTSPTANDEQPARRESAPIAFEAVQSAPALVPAKSVKIPYGENPVRTDLAPFFAGTTYDPRVPHPDTILPQPLGTFTAHHADVLRVMRAIAAKSDRVRIAPFGNTHEGRELVQVVIASPENLARIDDIRARIAKLADPRGVDAGELDQIVKDTPAIAWLAYSIHGDETSGTDASMAVAYHLAAGTSANVTDILRDVVVVIDPCQNPDGRERIIGMFEQSSGYVPDLDIASMRRGRWPYGRGNHYLFDMNRDWLWGTQPETRARWKAITSWHPQLLVDVHEMGANDTYLFYPATDPVTPYFPAFTRTWWQRYGADQAAAFDAHGWSYYTREWADSWYPGYTDAWATFQGACGILYEQARYGGGSVLKSTGEVDTYREAVQRQAVGSLSNVTTLAQNRAEVLRDYLAEKQRNVAADTAGNDRAFVLVPGRNEAREQEFIRSMVAQGVEVFTNAEKFSVTDADSVQGITVARDVPQDCYVIPAQQPLAPLVKAALAFDPRYDQGSLERERRELERKGQSKAYDVTAWSPAHAYGLDALWCAMPSVNLKPASERAEPGAATTPDAVDPKASVYGWIVDGREDGSVAFAARAMEAGLTVHITDEPFRALGRPFVRGSLLVRRVGNGPDARDIVQRESKAAGVNAVAVTSARSLDDGPDLGGRHFELLERPRVALLSNAPVSSDDFGHAWHMLDALYGVHVSLIDAQRFGFADLRRYNVLVASDGSGEVLRDHAEDLRTWVRAGGTLIALGGNAASALADEKLGLSAVRRRSDVLDDLGPYQRAVQREREAGKTTIDPAALWDGKVDAPTPAASKDEPKKVEGDEAKEQDRWAATFSPPGVILRGEVNLDSWITAGCDAELPVFFEGSGVLLSQPPTRTAVRLAASERLRFSGLLWPEARLRIADSAWLTVERQGAGQVILFAASPVFRGWFLGTSRLFANAVVYGPGLGASAPAPR